ncbi:MAG: hypothetical protein ABIO72_00255 [Patescibacteria group bacterium]
MNDTQATETEKKTETVKTLNSWGVMFSLEDAIKLCDGIVEIRSKPVPGDASPKQKDRFGREKKPHNGRNLKQANRVLFEGAAKYALPYGCKWDLIEAKGSTPAYYHAKVLDYSIHLRDGIKPPTKDGEVIKARIDVKIREITLADGSGKVNHYIYMNVFPLTEDVPSEEMVSIKIDDRLPNAREMDEMRIFSPFIDGKSMQRGYVILRKPTVTPAAK